MTRGLGRDLRAAQLAQARALPRWLEALHGAVGGEGTGDLARLIGVPTRRQVLRIGGLGIAGAALLAACSDEGDPEPPERRPGTTSTTLPDGPSAGPDADIVLLNTALSLEVLAIDAYRRAGETGLVGSAAVTDAFAMFQAHHAAHRDALIGVVEAAGVEPFAIPNPVVRVAFVDPELQAAVAEGDLVRLAHDIERAAAQTYVWATGTLSTADLRGRAMSIGAVEARHAAVLDAIGELAEESPARLPRTNPLPADALVEG
ncbi:MAG TPA: ferritin-like domain-containing protein [Acidimicrobiales bacterium]|nr:ferritin-like domain-containing protein [Acidimicrobiales bacterium]